MASIHCAFAVLLFTAGEAPTKDRLVITSYGADAHYGVYAPLPVGHFPVPDDDSGIYMTRSVVNGPGTYNTYYCTKDWDSATLVQKLVAGLTALPSSNDIFFDTSVAELQACDETIPLPDKPNATIPAMSQVMQSPVCTARVLASLARAARISLVGPHNVFAPSPDAALRTIYADIPVPMTDLIGAGHAFRCWDANRDRALVWYQGHLHLLARCPDQDLWYLYQEVGTEARGGDKISKFLKALNFSYGPSSKLLRGGRDSHQPDWTDGQMEETTIYNTETNIVQHHLNPSSIWGVMGKRLDCDNQEIDYYLSWL